MPQRMSSPTPAMVVLSMSNSKKEAIIRMFPPQKRGVLLGFFRRYGNDAAEIITFSVGDEETEITYAELANRIAAKQRELCRGVKVGKDHGAPGLSVSVLQDVLVGDHRMSRIRANEASIGSSLSADVSVGGSSNRHYGAL